MPVTAWDGCSRLLGAMILAVLLLLLSQCGKPVYAHPGDDPQAAWYRSLQTPEGGSCCNDTDCRPVEARLAGDHWEILLDTRAAHDPALGYGGAGGWVPVPPDRVLKRENLDGRPVACIFQGRILCFIPPAGA